MSDIRYNLRGVSAGKEDVHNAIKNIDKGLFPKAFCKIVPDYLTGDEDYCIVMHADGAGTKSSLAYMYWEKFSNIGLDPFSEIQKLHNKNSFRLGGCILMLSVCT